MIWLQLDDELLPEVRSVLAQYEARQGVESEAFLYLTGIGAAEHEDVIAVGKEIYSDIQILEGKIAETYELGETVLKARPNRLATPEWSPPFDCAFNEENCLAKIMEAKEQLSVEVKPWSEPRKRYLTFIQYDEYNSLTKPSFYEHWPEWRYLSIGNRIRIFELLLEASSGGAEQAWSELINDIARLRVQLSAGDLVLHKSVIARLIGNNLEALIYIKSHYLPERMANLPLLSDDELSFDSAIVRQLQGAFFLYTMMDRRPDFFARDGKLPGWIVRMTFKPNKTLNQSYLAFAQLNNLYRLPADEFAKQDLQIDVKDSGTFDITNIAGSTLASIGPADLSEYKAKLHDLNVKISLFNFLMNPDAELINPYYPNVPVDVPTSGKLCLDGPFPAESISRCIVINPGLRITR